MVAISDKILRRIRAKHRGWVFTAKDFLDLGNRSVIDQNLSRLARKGLVRRLGRGIYYYPKIHKQLGQLSPKVDQIADAIARNHGRLLYPAGSKITNLLGFSDQVPMKISYITNGPAMVKKIEGNTIHFYHARVPIMDKIPKDLNYIIQALSYLGKNNINQTIVTKCAYKINAKDLKEIQKVQSRIPNWMVETFNKIRDIQYGQISKINS